MNSFGAQTKLKCSAKEYDIYKVDSLNSLCDTSRLPVSIRILLESLLRHEDGNTITEDTIREAAKYDPANVTPIEIPFRPSRVLLQDFTGVPAIVDLAALRAAMARIGGDPKKINPLVPVDLVIDHSVQVDFFGAADSVELNVEREFERNRERYEFLHWGQHAFQNLRVVPPATGICHQVNLEYLASVVSTSDGAAFPDTLVGTDSHTVMINGLAVLGWGVGGIEAEAAMLGQPIYMLMPEVVGFEMTGELPQGATGTDLVLTVTQLLREKGVVGKFVEYFGDALDKMSLPTKAMIANMAPEYGATMGFFPVDDSTLDYLRLTGRSAESIELVERYSKEQGFYRSSDSTPPLFADKLKLDLSTVEPSLAGPKRPQDRVKLSSMKSTFRSDMSASLKERGFAIPESEQTAIAKIKNGEETEVGHGFVVIAAITSCTNTSDPYVLLAAGILARNAVKKGLNVKPYVKTSLSPGSRVVTDYLERSGYLKDLEKLGFYNVGYGCTTCIGNSGPLAEEVVKAIEGNNLVASAVLSGNRNFEGRVNPHTRANYLASPPLVVAYALAGSVDIDLTTEPIGYGNDGEPVYLKDIWPNDEEVTGAIKEFVTPEMFEKQYSSIFDGNPVWNRIKGKSSDLYEWDKKSTYIQEPPFFANLEAEPEEILPVRDARVLAMLGDSITTDHISPAGAIKSDSPAGKYLLEHDVSFASFNSYGSRRGNDRIMTRGTFANIRLRNQLVPGSEGGVTLYHPDGSTMSIYDAAQKYMADNVPLVVLAGKDYGMGSSRDWAAKGTSLLGVRAVLAQSYERIHRSNLVGMGVLPLQFLDGDSLESLEFSGSELFTIEGLNNDLKPRQRIGVKALSKNGERKFEMIVRIDTQVEIDYYRHGGILQMVLRQLAKG